MSHHRARVVTGASLAALVLLGAGEARAAQTATTSYTTPGRYAFTVPPGVTSVQATVVGGAGGRGWCVVSSAGGQGASITATLPVTPGEALVVGVGAPGAVTPARARRGPAASAAAAAVAAAAAAGTSAAAAAGAARRS